MVLARLFLLAVILQLKHHSPLDSNRMEVQKEVRICQYEKLWWLQMQKLHQEFERGSLEDQQEEQQEASWSRMMIQEGKGRWSLWSLGAIGTFFIFIFLWQYQQKRPFFNSIEVEDEVHGLDTVLPLTLLHLSDYPEYRTIEKFYKRQVHTEVHHLNHGFEFVEQFTGKLLKACQGICHRESGVVLKDGVGVGSTFEKWSWKKPPTFDVLVPFHPPQGYAFRVDAVCWQGIPDLRGFYRVTLEPGCICKSTQVPSSLHLKGDDTNSQSSMPLEVLLCTNTYLDTQKVHTWFQALVGKAWGIISYRYDFTLTVVPSTSCKLRLEHKSGCMLYINMIPAVRREESLIFLVRQATHIGDVSVVYWLESFTIYERQFLKLIRRFVPENSCHLKCLSILTHLKEITMPASHSFLSSYHFKTALMHLLTMLPADAWSPERIGKRVQDVLGYLGHSLCDRHLDHFTIGNPCLPLEIAIPKELRNAEPLNLFHSLQVEQTMYAQAQHDFQLVMSMLHSLNSQTL